MLWLAPAGLRGGTKLEAYHQSRQPLPFSLCCPRSSGLRFVVQDVAASLGPAVAAAAIRFLTDVAASCLIPGSAFRHGCIHALGPGIVVPRALWRPSGRLFRQGHFFHLSRRCCVSCASCCGSGNLLLPVDRSDQSHSFSAVFALLYFQPSVELEVERTLRRFPLDHSRVSEKV